MHLIGSVSRKSLIMLLAAKLGPGEWLGLIFDLCLSIRTPHRKIKQKYLIKCVSQITERSKLSCITNDSFARFPKIFTNQLTLHLTWCEVMFTNNPVRKFSKSYCTFEAASKINFHLFQTRRSTTRQSGRRPSSSSRRFTAFGGETDGAGQWWSGVWVEKRRHVEKRQWRK